MVGENITNISLSCSLQGQKRFSEHLPDALHDSANNSGNSFFPKRDIWNVGDVFLSSLQRGLQMVKSRNPKYLYGNVSMN